MFRKEFRYKKKHKVKNNWSNTGRRDLIIYCLIPELNPDKLGSRV